MLQPFSITTVFIAALWVCVSGQQAGAWQPPTEQVVVLSNGQTLLGAVDQQPDKVSVHLPSGSRIVLPVARVAFVCDTFPEAYWELAGHTRSTDLPGQIGVFKWCVRNNLFEEAANHLLILQEMDIPAKTMMQLDVSLQISQKRQQESTQKKLTATAQNAAAVASSSTTNQTVEGLQSVAAIQIPNLHRAAEPALALPNLPAIDQFGNEVDGQIQQVSWEQPVAHSAPAVDLETVDAAVLQRLSATQSLSYSDLDRLTHSMPKGTVGFFRKQVEPLLQASCVGCHRSSATDRSFKIYQGRSGVIDRRMSQKNLYQSLILSNHENPSASALVGYATVAHGNQSQPSFQWGHPQLTPLKQWLIKVSANPGLPIQEFSARHQVASLPRPVTAVEQTDFTERLPSVKPTSPGTGQSENSKPLGPHQTVLPLDPFDADVFNRKYGTQ